MKQKAILPLFSGFVLTALAFEALWQLLVLTLLVRGMTNVLELVGRVL